MRNVFLVCYDVADDKRLRKTYKKMCGFGDAPATICPMPTIVSSIFVLVVVVIISYGPDAECFGTFAPLPGRMERPL